MMAHYAFLDSNNVVTEVIVGKNEGEEGIDWEVWYGEFRGQVCKRTSYNNNIRKQYAGVGYIYNPDADVFISLSPFDSWLLNETFDWAPPIPKPEEGFWNWKEETLSWEVDNTYPGVR